MSRNKKDKQSQTRKNNPPAVLIADPIGIRKNYLWLSLILLISFLVYLPVLQNNLLAWDDESYIITNKLIHKIDLKNIFSSYVMGNYHPLTILAHAIEYKMFGLNEKGYHIVNLVLHLLNVILVFFVILRLSSKSEIALVASLLFGIHPLHVESVAWAAELKDLLYTFFFLASYVFYLKFIDDQKKKYYAYALILFLAALLSKAMAASLPIIFLLTDYFKGRKINAMGLLEKAPFFILAMVFGVVAINAQKTAGATEIIDINILQRMAFAGYSFFMYLIKMIIPLNLSAYYPYPMENGTRFISQFYIYIPLILIFVAAVIYSLRYSRQLFYSLGFFAITIFLVLQLIPVGGAHMADRYSYIPSIGIFYLAGVGFHLLINNKPKWVALLFLSVFASFFAVKTFTRCKVWKNDLILWSDVISQYKSSPQAYYGRGTALMKGNKSLEAISDFNKAIQLNPDYVTAYINRGISFLNENRHDEAIKDFDKAIASQPERETAYANRGKAYLGKNMHEEAIKDYNKFIELKPDLIEGYYNRGTLFMKIGKTDEALQDFNRTIDTNPKFIDAYINRGIIYYKQNRFSEAISNFSKAIQLKSDYANAYYLRGLSEHYMGNKEAACKDLNKAAGLRFQLAIDAIPKICN